MINTIQAGEMPTTVAPWTQIANLGQGSFFQVEQAGGAVAYTSPFDDEIAVLSAKLDDTRLYYGNEEEKARMLMKVAATDKLEQSASVASRARRGVFNAAVGGRANLLGENELVDAVASGTIELADLELDTLPEALKPMAPAEQQAYVARLADERADLKRQIQVLSADRDGYIAKKVDEAGGMKDSLDVQLYEAIKEQAGKAGLEYEKGPSY